MEVAVSTPICNDAGACTPDIHPETSASGTSPVSALTSGIANLTTEEPSMIQAVVESPRFPADSPTASADTSFFEGSLGIPDRPFMSDLSSPSAPNVGVRERTSPVSALTSGIANLTTEEPPMFQAVVESPSFRADSPTASADTSFFEGSLDTADRPFVSDLSSPSTPNVGVHDSSVAEGRVDDNCESITQDDHEYDEPPIFPTAVAGGGVAAKSTTPTTVAIPAGSTSPSDQSWDAATRSSTHVADPITEEQKHTFNDCVIKAKQHAANGELAEALTLLRRSQSIVVTEKVQRKIAKLEARIAAVEVRPDGWTIDPAANTATLPGGFEIPLPTYGALYTHQREGIKWFWGFQSKHQVGGILGDDMGMGKTIQVSTFLNGVLSAGDLAQTVCVYEPDRL
jgi:hypothetical protein